MVCGRGERMGRGHHKDLSLYSMLLNAAQCKPGPRIDM